MSTPVREGGWTLVHDTEGRKAGTVNETVTSFRGDNFTLLGGSPPHNELSTGRVLVRPVGEKQGETSYYPGVVGMRWVLDNPPA